MCFACDVFANTTFGRITQWRVPWSLWIWRQIQRHLWRLSLHRWWRIRITSSRWWWRTRGKSTWMRRMFPRKYNYEHNPILIQYINQFIYCILSYLIAGSKLFYVLRGRSQWCEKHFTAMAQTAHLESPGSGDGSVHESIWRRRADAERYSNSLVEILGTWHAEC